MSQSTAKNLNRSPQAAHPVDLACLGVMLTISNVMQNDAIGNAKETGNAIWQAVIIASAVGIVLALLAAAALRAFLDDEMRDWFTLTRELSGRAGVRISAVALFLLFLDTAKMTVVSMETTSVNEFLFNTPIIIVTGIFLLICAIAARKKMRGVIRISRILLISNAMIVALILLIAWSAYVPERLFPIGGYGLGTTARVGVRMAGDIFCDMLILCLALPVQRGQHGMRGGLRLAVGMAIPFLIILALCYAMAYPVSGNEYLLHPIKQLAVVSEFGRYIQRLSPLLVFVWSGAFLTGGSSMLYGMARSWGALFGIEDEQPMLWTFAALLFAVVMIPDNVLPFPLRERLSGYVRIGLFLIAVLPALIGRLLLKVRRAAHA